MARTSEDDAATLSPRRGNALTTREGALPVRCVQWGMNALYGGLVTLAPPWAAFRFVTNAKARSRWLAYARHMAERFGRRKARRDFSRPCVWLHGVSVGEVRSAARFVERIEETVPGVEMLLSVTTDTGFRVARQRYPGRRIEYFPPDASWVVEDALDAVRPDLMVLVESELWPNFLASVRHRNVPIVLVNGRMSERSARRFKRVPWLAQALVGALDKVFVQLPVYAERYRSLGVPDERLVVTGNMKFDNIPFKPPEGRRRHFAALFGIEAGANWTVVGGSTHPGEERILAALHREAREAGRPFRLIVAPRHPGRREAVVADIRREGGRAVLRSTLGDTPPDKDAVIILDTVGELEVVYALADAVVIGGSFIPHGGQNMMEPASLGKPVIVGPSTSNFRGEVAMLTQVGGLREVSHARELGELLQAWRANPAEANAVGARARDAILASKGATERTLEGLQPYLDALRKRT